MSEYNPKEGINTNVTAKPITLFDNLTFEQSIELNKLFQLNFGPPFPDWENCFSIEYKKLTDSFQFEKRTEDSDQKGIDSIIFELNYRIKDITETYSRLTELPFPENVYSEDVKDNTPLSMQRELHSLYPSSESLYPYDENIFWALLSPFNSVLGYHSEKTLSEIFEELEKAGEYLSEDSILEVSSKLIELQLSKHNLETTYHLMSDFRYRLVRNTKLIYERHKQYLSCFMPDSRHLAAAKLSIWIPSYLEAADSYFCHCLERAERRKGELPILPEELYSNPQPEKLTLTETIIAMERELQEVFKKTNKQRECHKLVLARFYTGKTPESAEGKKLMNSIKTMFDQLKNKGKLNLFKD